MNRIQYIKILVALSTFYFIINTQNVYAFMINDISSGEKSLRVAGAKLSVSDNIDTNIASIKKAIDFASKEGADILVTPEGSLSGWDLDCYR